MSVQTPVHKTREPGQPLSPQLLSVHRPVGQTIPQPPQLSGSLDAFTHAPLHWMTGAEQMQFALTHVSPPVQRMPQPPQLSASL